MRTLLPLLAIVACGLLAVSSSANAATETWLLLIQRWGNTEYRVLTLERSDGALVGWLGAWPVTGRRTGNRLQFIATDDDGDRHAFDAVMTADGLEGHADYPDTNDDAARARHAFRGRLLVMPAPGAPRTLSHEPTTYSNEFTAHREPILVVRPGDVVRTRTIDSGGVDASGTTKALYGNPQTGPFFVAGAEPGDVLAVHIRRLTLDRDYADSLDGFVGRAMTPALAVRAAGLGQRVRWRLDRAANVARLEHPPAGLKDYVVPLRPMLGGIGVAPDFGFAPASAGDTGRFGGNLDFNGIIEGVTVYLQVFQPGALLYFGDGHALQGDGETTQWALETSLTLEFSVDLLPSRPMSAPRVESADRITIVGQGGSLDDALRSATASMVQWLQQDYGLDARDSSLVIGTIAEFRVATLAGRNAGMALSLPKALLPVPESGPTGRLGRQPPAGAKPALRH